MTQNQAPQPRLVYYPGHHGRTTASTMRNPNRAMKWERGQVRLVPAPEASDYTRLGGYLPAMTKAEVMARFGLTSQAITALADQLTTASYTAEGAKEDEEVYVLDTATARALRGYVPPPAIPADLAALSWPEIQKLGTAHGITGKKAEIIAALEAARPAAGAEPTTEPTTTDPAPEA